MTAWTMKKTEQPLTALIDCLQKLVLETQSAKNSDVTGKLHFFTKQQMTVAVGQHFCSPTCLCISINGIANNCQVSTQSGGLFRHLPASFNVLFLLHLVGAVLMSCFP